ncbi:unannotated protein [freshwater metagenome]|uniref:Unannotated protein n=1 Tax=freshwater metagenome TaxID=449393 RepID=A0A6J7IL37_9ZZZZ|nr:TetR family transcriptional regulator [Actinomycetota bacterium]
MKTSRPITAPRRADAQRNVEHILDTARAALAADPGASLQRIAAASGLHRATVYRHFENRENLIRAIHERFVEQMREASMEVDSEASDPVGELRSFSKRSLEIGLRFSPYGYAPLFPVEDAERRRARRAPVVALLRHGQERGVFRTDLDAEAVAGLWGVTLPFVLSQISISGWTREQAVAFMVSVPLAPAAL